jgi:hypothetical protein
MKISKYLHFHPSLVTPGNTLLLRELGEVIPICLAKLNRLDEAFHLFKGKLPKFHVYPQVGAPIQCFVKLLFKGSTLLGKRQFWGQIHGKNLTSSNITGDHWLLEAIKNELQKRVIFCLKKSTPP